ncbi:hypothetical protein FIBSPDRAFT_828958 [Athelia psychrophila]|uniref:Hemerythrin-like domain-containing protein n=1 Tax=Athelia psychrophila TaxID=1759441 RepID=A0A166HBI3_9AGAM|nr:hypothetical protein FIBSPDRAFT_828958 [Fibularhizoctonia sp. CBS 109695]
MSAGKLEITHEIKIDHDNVRDLWSRFQSANGDEERASIANTLIREMAIHSDAEEISVYNEYPKLGLGDAQQHSKEEHAQVKKLVYDADMSHPTTQGYDDVLGKAVTAFVGHAQEEEDHDFPKIKAALSPEDSDKLARSFLKARNTVPTRPHPVAPQTGGIAQKAAGGVGSLHDKIVEKIGGREFVDLKYTHPESF